MMFFLMKIHYDVSKQPDSAVKQRQRMHYEPSADHIQCDEARAMHEILLEHFYANTPEMERYRLVL